MEESSLAEAFCAELPEARRQPWSTLTSLGSDLRGLLESSRRAFGGIELDALAFARELGRRLPPGLPPAPLSQLRAKDVYLVACCCRGDPKALGVLDEHYIRPMGRKLGHLHLSADQLAELNQRVREQLLVRSPDGRLLLDDFAGRGDLRGWLHVVALREGLRLLKRPAAAEPDALEHHVSPTGDPELALLKTTYRDEFNRVLRDGLRALSPRERNLLRQHFVEGLSIDQLGNLYSVHRATAARWVVRAQHGLAARLRRELLTKLGVGGQELQSLARLLRSQLHVSLRRLESGEGESR